MLPLFHLKTFMILIIFCLITTMSNRYHFKSSELLECNINEIQHFLFCKRINLCWVFIYLPVFYHIKVVEITFLDVLHLNYSSLSILFHWNKWYIYSLLPSTQRFIINFQDKEKKIEWIRKEVRMQYFTLVEQKQISEKNYIKRSL